MRRSRRTTPIPRGPGQRARALHGHPAPRCGDAGLPPFAGTGPDVEPGYTTARSAWGKGYATEAAEALVDHAFGPLGLPRVLAQVEPANTGSRHVLDKLGMEERGQRLAYGRPHLLYVLEATRRASPRASPPR